MSNIEQYLPTIYKNIRETDELMRVENGLFNNVDTHFQQLLANQFIRTANEDGIVAFEQVFKIKPNPVTETLEFRRQRLLNRSSTNAPLTLKFLEQKLDEIIGVGKWSITTDNEHYTIYIETSAENQLWYHEILVTVTAVKPANMIFINRPLITAKIKANESISKSHLNWNYVLGISWQLGAKPFASMSNEELIKMSTTQSIDNNLINSIATFTAGKIAKVRINNTEIITSFVVKSATDRTVTIQYNIPNTITGSAITKVELLDSSSNVLATSAVYVPILSDLVFKHTMIIEEG